MLSVFHYLIVNIDFVVMTLLAFKFRKSTFRVNFIKQIFISLVLLIKSSVDVDFIESTGQQYSHK